MKALKYSDICLIPNYSECMFRSDNDVSVEMCGYKFNLPIIPANMKSVIDMKTAKSLDNERCFYIMHRFGNSLLKDIEKANEENWNVISFSVGAKAGDKAKILKLSKSNLRVDFLTIDIAHGHSLRMKRMIQYIRKKLPDTKIIAGNVSRGRAVLDLYNWGADIVKVGIGQGSPCTTKDKTGFTMPMFTCTSLCSQLELESGYKIPIIADGGIRSNGDIAKAIAAGATMVMAGSLFASCIDSPATPLDINGVNYKAYFGSASAENKGHNMHIEGKLKKIQNNGMTYIEKLTEIKQDLQSAISYAGGSDLSSLFDCEYMITNNHE